MTGPSIEIVLRRRHFVRIIIRLTLVLLVVVALAPMVWRFIYQIPYNWGNFTQRPFYTFRDELVQGLTYLAIAAVLWLLENRLVRFIVPLAKPDCPECGYLLRQLTTTRCPECGCDLGSAGGALPKGGA